MNLLDFIKEFMLTRLRESNLFDINSSTYVKTDYNNTIVGLINEALRHLYVECNPVTKRVLLKVSVPRTIYKLRKEYAKTDSSTSVKYIEDTVHFPFEGNVIKVLKVIDGLGNILPINEYNNLASVQLLECDVLQFTFLNYSESPYSFYEIVYLEGHKELVSDNLNTQTINISYALKEMFTHYLAFKVFSNYQTKNHYVEAQKHYEIYNNLYAKHKEDGNFVIINTFSNDVFDRNGYL